MLISTHWIREFTAVPELPGREIAERVTLATAEVESVSERHTHLQAIRVVQIVGIRKHPQADRLNLVSFDDGSSRREVVCGAGNVREGLKVPFAPWVPNCRVVWS